MKYLCLLSSLTIFFYSCTDRVRHGKKENNIFYDKAYEYREKKEPDSAFFYFNKAKDFFLQQKDSLGAAKCLVNMGIISTDKGDYFGAQEISLNALSYLDEKKEDQYMYIHSNFNNLGIATENLGDYERALKFYDSAISFSKDSLDMRIYLNNKAKIYRELKDYKAALKIYEQILKGAVKSKKEYARVLTNISFTRWLQDPNYNPIPDYLKALHIRKEEKDLFGENSSYSHLADYYAKNETDSALAYANRMYQVAKKLNSADDKLEALQKLIKLSPPKETKQYFVIYRDLEDSLQTVHRAAKNQFALIRYETEKHKADFLKAHAENIQKENDILRKNIGIGVLALVLIAGYLWYRKRKKILYQEKELEVKNTEIKYVKKIHDRVANKVYQVMSEVENTQEVNRDNLLDKLEILYNISRDISYEVKELNMEKDYAQQLAEMIRSYSSESIEVFIVGNEEKLWDCISNTAKAEVFYIIQELMTNMRKHSKAETVVIKFHRSEEDISISYFDNGIGMKDIPKKNGLVNTGTRIKSIGGTITFDTTQDKELKIQLSFPIP